MVAHWKNLSPCKCASHSKQERECQWLFQTVKKPTFLPRPLVIARTIIEMFQEYYLNYWYNTVLGITDVKEGRSYTSM